jgi:threonine/homoserine/homoserine lactone efflux protein
LILNLISQGVVIVMILTFSFGPAFFALINAGIREGYKHGSMLAIGIVLSDLFLSVVISILIYLGLGSVLNSSKSQDISSVVGGAILLIFGVTYFLKKSFKADDREEPVTQVSAFFLISQGFLLNLFNPAVWFLWLANATAIGKTVHFSLVKMILYFLVILGIVLCLELGKVFLAGKIKHFLTVKMMNMINYVTGMALIIFGIVLIYNFIIK